MKGISDPRISRLLLAAEKSLELRHVSPQTAKMLKDEMVELARVPGGEFASIEVRDYVQGRDPATVGHWRRQLRTPSLGPNSESSRAPGKPSGRLVSHGRRIAELVLRHPEVLLDRQVIGVTVEDEHVAYAVEHLKEYREIRAAEHELRSAEADREWLRGKPGWGHRSNDAPRGGEAGSALLYKVRQLNGMVFPGFPEQSDHGPNLPQATLPRETGGEVWREIGSYNGVGSPMGFEVVLEPLNGGWRVCRPHSTAYAFVAKEERAKATKLQEALARIVRDPELGYLYREDAAIAKLVSEKESTYLTLVKDLANRILDGEVIKESESCRQGY